jgi:hypothetical protein
MEHDAGLFFVCDQRDPRAGFISIFDNLSKFDMLPAVASSLVQAELSRASSSGSPYSRTADHNQCGRACRGDGRGRCRQRSLGAGVKLMGGAIETLVAKPEKGAAADRVY